MNINLIKLMHAKFGIDKVDFSQEESKFRIMCLEEELQELRDAFDNYYADKSIENEAEIIDAILDLTIFAMGTLDRMGYSQATISGCYADIMKANMNKIIKNGNAKRNNFKIDLVKPDNWEPADLVSILNTGIKNGTK